MDQPVQEFRNSLDKYAASVRDEPEGIGPRARASGSLTDEVRSSVLHPPAKYRRPSKINDWYLYGIHHIPWFSFIACTVYIYHCYSLSWTFSFVASYGACSLREKCCSLRNRLLSGHTASVCHHIISHNISTHSSNTQFLFQQRDSNINTVYT